ncbi:Flavin-dependent oxidoreductase, luciferase family (includes alkanesulfonate monooxygenase SsuD and methylene tetrahydromethanopterin reductase) [Xaviernesmea oryzae]|uniref:Flavin-dependent oxidoreductase, luciferase family (Includes alkanesulfonate monooxygenase SsuD and methylene tetrahydromethanopterin reductase) n=1 Tax=Xaviernesmea oryzae TaxID=464029 RepID=A0A1X7G202_9HYPH|nr:LLM class flavin-dependent oxidoreductase [Xaviernesmea oryzae]SMF62414.1 Flavin-dependent oxidoreductase, luciferase family (includes alkanesulfonate monooxygenase SsuD and methylene tetrahydromethanopterin reductase) [Xaviernesmea oryzae]
MQKNIFMNDGPAFKLGLFGYLHDGGVTMTKAAERWPGRWDDIAAMATYADEAGLDFLLPYARWKGMPGEIPQRTHSFETITHAAALSGITRRIGVFATVHTSIIHPAIAAKMMMTVDQASHGRAGLNIVCGWNQDDFDMFGIEQLPHDERYQHGREWFSIWSRLTSGTEAPFDYDGRHFTGIKQAFSQPGSVQRPWPLVISAAYSPAGRSFAIDTSDYLLTVMEDVEAGRKELAALATQAEAAGRKEPLKPIAVCYVVCRETRAEAEAFHRYYAEENADNIGVDYWLQGRQTRAMLPDALYKLRSRIAGGNTNFPLIGTPQDIADQIVELHEAGFAGAGIGFLNYLTDVPVFVEKVVPLLKKAGLRG